MLSLAPLAQIPKQFSPTIKKIGAETRFGFFFQQWRMITRYNIIFPRPASFHQHKVPIHSKLCKMTFLSLVPLPKALEQ